VGTGAAVGGFGRAGLGEGCGSSPGYVAHSGGGVAGLVGFGTGVAGFDGFGTGVTVFEGFGTGVAGLEGFGTGVALRGGDGTGVGRAGLQVGDGDGTGVADCGGSDWEGRGAVSCAETWRTSAGESDPAASQIPAARTPAPPRPASASAGPRRIRPLSIM
jgi:hypothetical protein